jgi:hypothetical protein
MSNYLAIATVTAALRSILQEAATVAVPGATVTLKRPDHANTENADKASINLYLYQASPNTTWRNADLPTRLADGRLLQRPQIAMDLYYLLSFYGSELEMEPQRLLGNVALALHTQAILQADTIQQAINNISFLAQSDLSKQVEQVKFNALNLSLEELSKLWSVFFQVPYTLSIAYSASAVLIDADITPIEVLPVLTRNIRVQPEVK